MGVLLSFAFQPLALSPLLCGWCAAPPGEGGGMRKADDREVATASLDAPLKESLDPRPVNFEGDGAPDGKPKSQWLPKPCNPHLVLEAQRGRLGLGPWKAMVGDPLT